jgi:SWI/SNF-related matrix-associated actin-dependent regulator of chromatin subfamily A3
VPTTDRLLRHQEEGLDFMMQRESGPVPPEFSLWQPIELAGKPWWACKRHKVLTFCLTSLHFSFRHLITRAESHLPPSETGGGVLADEMGMGKSLSILSLITKTLDDACAWKSDETVGQSSGFQVRKQGSRATLVVVSSGCRYFERLSLFPT